MAPNKRKTPPAAAAASTNGKGETPPTNLNEAFSTPKKTKTGAKTNEAVELAKNWYLDDPSNVFADVLGIKQSYDMLVFNHNKTFKIRPVSAGLADDNTDTWAKQHMDLVNSYFKKGTLDMENAIKLGLTAEWVAPNELPSAEAHDGNGQNINLESAENSEEDEG